MLRDANPRRARILFTVITHENRHGEGRTMQPPCTRSRGGIGENFSGA